MKNFEIKIMNNMCLDGIIPSSIFEIKENHLISFMEYYGKMFGYGKYGTRSNKRFARKLAGLSLLKYNEHFGATLKDIKAGLVYLIENPSFPEHFKVGMILNLDKRLSVYQTYDPYRKFKVSKYEFVLDRKIIEKQILQNPNINNENGEWIEKVNAIQFFSEICTVI